MTKRSRRMMVIAGLVGVLAGAASGCRSVQPWERGNLALTPMEADGAMTQRFEASYQTYREGAAGGDGASSGGGCGCS